MLDRIFSVRLLKRRLSKDLPGSKAHRKMSPVLKNPVNFSISESEAKPAGVLILLIPNKGRWFLVLTERTAEVEHHQGQVSFPGGAQEKGETFKQTALRETKEELGIDPFQIRVIGQLSSLFIPISGFRVHPFVAWIKEKPLLKPDPREVKLVHFVALDRLFSSDCIKKEVRQIRHQEVMVPYFDFEGLKVWGATAMILNEFREICLSSAKSSCFRLTPHR